MRSCSFHAVLTRVSPRFAPFFAGESLHKCGQWQEQSDWRIKKLVCAAAFFCSPQMSLGCSDALPTAGQGLCALAANCSDVMSFLGIVVLSISHTKRYFWRTRRAIQLTASLGLLSVSPRQDGCLDATHRDMCSRGLRVRYAPTALSLTSTSTHLALEGIVWWYHMYLVLVRPIFDETIRWNQRKYYISRNAHFHVFAVIHTTMH